MNEAKHKYKVGNWVTVRSWSDMDLEFGTDWSGDIDLPIVFSQDMRCYCEQTLKILSIDEDGRIRLEDAFDWTFTKEMFQSFDSLQSQIRQIQQEIYAK